MPASSRKSKIVLVAEIRACARESEQQALEAAVGTRAHWAGLRDLISAAPQAGTGAEAYQLGAPTRSILNRVAQHHAETLRHRSGHLRELADDLAGLAALITDAPVAGQDRARADA